MCYRCNSQITKVLKHRACQIPVYPLAFFVYYPFAKQLPNTWLCFLPFTYIYFFVWILGEEEYKYCFYCVSYCVSPFLCRQICLTSHQTSKQSLFTPVFWVVKWWEETQNPGVAFQNTQVPPQRLMFLWLTLLLQATHTHRLRGCIRATEELRVFFPKNGIGHASATFLVNFQRLR